ncbi:hypothetical protein ACQQ2Q_08775 [Agrobacterium sp. ES01]|uniref:hypothetical protein n=1 Tax=Agrobacterium sp. ES01 TaxID=3420714 RepID=UPI003D12F09B
MSDKPNEAFIYARRISDYFTIVLHIAIGAGAAFALFELSAAHPEHAALNETIAIVIGLCTLYIAAAFFVSILIDLRSSRFKASRGLARWLELLAPLVALGFLISFIYFARTTAQMMM